MTKGGIHQKQYVIRTDLDGTVSVVGAIGGDKEWASDLLFRFRYVDKLGVQISSNGHFGASRAHPVHSC